MLRLRLMHMLRIIMLIHYYRETLRTTVHNLCDIFCRVDEKARLYLVHSVPQLSPTVFFPCERNFIFFLLQFASTFVDNGEIESVPR
jgi:hypothetical protein